jgi:hypothetical protein
VSDFKPGDIVDITLKGARINADHVTDDIRILDVTCRTRTSHLITFDEASVAVVSADEPTPYERSLTILADWVADLNATAKRCDDAGRPGVAIERRTEEDAVRLALVAVIEVGGDDLAAAIVRAHTLIAEAVKRRG